MEGTPSSSSGLSRRLWGDAQVQASVLRALHHPFVIALASGVLPREAFQSYIAEDAFFLKSFAEGYSAAISRCGPGQEHVARGLGELLQGVQEELKLHDSYAAEWGVDLSQHQQPNPATRAYVDWVHAIAQDPKQGVAGILSAMVPCLRLYAFLACQLAKGYPFADHEYTEWVRSYSSAEYLRLPAKAEALLDETGGTEDFGVFLFASPWLLLVCPILLTPAGQDGGAAG
ncbi:family transcriptional regulator [Chlorella sorokiniana]|uniref:Family transcriptional regulator n=1 Tax=Chlorella sorokiniana TaxID=3076 RepID=A0A2P6THD7_CHLSO|nr:family transcriptional regulator [Chlorella sorokiniana]|eukprot:PRW33704.1 family transcriptional regulator [Chlorella sorokiniana]